MYRKVRVRNPMTLIFRKFELFFSLFFFMFQTMLLSFVDIIYLIQIFDHFSFRSFKGITVFKLVIWGGISSDIRSEICFMATRHRSRKT